MTLNSDGTIASETGWSGSGGGVSRFESAAGLSNPNTANIARHGAPDVSINANPFTGYAVYDSLAYQGHRGWQVIGGTSAGAPQWAALIAIANQGRVATAAPARSMASPELCPVFIRSTIRPITATLQRRSHPAEARARTAHSGWDAVTGLGTPKADAIANELSQFWIVRTDYEPTVAVTNATTRKTAQPQFEPAHESVARRLNASLPDRAATPSLFSSVHLRSRAVDSVATRPAVSRNCGHRSRRRPVGGTGYCGRKSAPAAVERLRSLSSRVTAARTRDDSFHRTRQKNPSHSTLASFASAEPQRARR